MKEEERNEKQSHYIPDEYFEALLRGESITETIQTRRGKWVVAFQGNAETLAIAQRMSDLIGGRSMESISANQRYWLNIFATLEVLVQKGPKGWDRMRCNYPDPFELQEVYRRGLTLRDEVCGFQRSETVADNAAGEDSAEPAADERAATEADIKPQKPLHGSFWPRKRQE